MNLLAICLNDHDMNMSYYDGAQVHYHKLERSKQVKRYAWADHYSWIADIKQLWNVELSDIDEIWSN